MLVKVIDAYLVNNIHRLTKCGQWSTAQATKLCYGELLQYLAEQNCNKSTGWTKKPDHFWKLITPVYDGLERQFEYDIELLYRVSSTLTVNAHYSKGIQGV